MKTKAIPSSGHILPLLLNNEGFRQAWAMWEQHRKEKHVKLTPTAAKLQLKRLEAMGPDRAVDAIVYSIQQGYTGLFEPRQDQRQPARGRCAGNSNNGF